MLVSIYSARYFGPEKIGLYYYCLSIASFFIVFIKFGLEQVTVKLLVEDPACSEDIIKTCFFLKLMIYISFSLIFLSSIYIFDMFSVIETVIIMMLLFGISFQATDVIDFKFQAIHQAKKMVLPRFFAFVISSSCKLLILYYQGSIILFAAFNVIELMILSLFSVMAYKKNGYLLKGVFRVMIAKKLFKRCWPLALSSLLITIHMKVDQIMIANMMSNFDLGVYGITVRLVEIWYFIPTIIITAAFPYFIELRKSNEMDVYTENLKLLYSSMFWMSFLIGMVFFAFGETIIEILFGQDYISGYAALIINIWAGIFVSQSLVRGIWLIDENLQRYRLYNNVGMVAINITLNYFIIPIYGISGAAFTTLVSQALITWLIPLFIPTLRASTIVMIKSSNPLFLMKGLMTLRKI